MRNAIDSSMQPCDDFYQFACGNFLKTKRVSENEIFNRFAGLSNYVEFQLKKIIEDGIDSKESREFELVNQLYKSCMNVDNIKAFGMHQFNQIIRKTVFGSKVDSEKWDETAFDWIESIRQMRAVGFPTDHLMDTKVIPNFKNSSIRSITVIYVTSCTNNLPQSIWH